MSCAADPTWLRAQDRTNFVEERFEREKEMIGEARDDPASVHEHTVEHGIGIACPQLNDDALAISLRDDVFLNFGYKADAVHRSDEISCGCPPVGSLAAACELFLEEAYPRLELFDVSRVLPMSRRAERNELLVSTSSTVEVN